MEKKPIAEEIAEYLTNHHWKIKFGTPYEDLDIRSFDKHFKIVTLQKEEDNFEDIAKFSLQNIANFSLQNIAKFSLQLLKSEEDDFKEEDDF